MLSFWSVFILGYLGTVREEPTARPLQKLHDDLSTTRQFGWQLYDHHDRHMLFGEKKYGCKPFLLSNRNFLSLCLFLYFHHSPLLLFVSFFLYRLKSCTLTICLCLSVSLFLSSTSICKVWGWYTHLVGFFRPQAVWPHSKSVQIIKLTQFLWQYKHFYSQTLILY